MALLDRALNNPLVSRPRVVERRARRSNSRLLQPLKKLQTPNEACAVTEGTLT